MTSRTLKFEGPVSRKVAGTLKTLACVGTLKTAQCGLS